VASSGSSSSVAFESALLSEVIDGVPVWLSRRLGAGAADVFERFGSSISERIGVSGLVGHLADDEPSVWQLYRADTRLTIVIEWLHMTIPCSRYSLSSSGLV